MGEGNYLDVDGNKIYYEKHGSGEKIIVLLPGVLGKLKLILVVYYFFMYFIPGNKSVIKNNLIL